MSADSAPRAPSAATNLAFHQTSAAPYFGLASARAAEIVCRVEAAVGTWRAVATRLGMSDRDLEQVEEAFENPDREIARTA